MKVGISVVTEFPGVGTENTLYINYQTGQSQLYTLSGYTPTSIGVLTALTGNLTDEVVPGALCTKNYIDTKINSVGIFGLSAYLTKSAAENIYATKESLSGFITINDIPEEVIYVEEFPASDLTEHAIYVNKNKQVKIRVNGEWLDLSLEVVNELSTSSTNVQIANAKAVYDFVINKIAEAKLDGGNVDLTGYLTKTEAINTYANKTDIPTNTSNLINDSDFITAEVIKDFITLADIPEEVIYEDEFPVSGVNQAIYVNKDKQVKIWVNNQWLNLSAEISSVITENSSNTTIPDSKTVYDFVINKITEAKLSGGFTDLTGYLTKSEADSTYATINSVSNKTEIVVGDIPTTGTENILYINNDGAVSTVINDEMTIISLEAMTDLSANTNNDKSVPTCKAVADYVNNILGDIEAQLSEI